MCPKHMFFRGGGMVFIWRGGGGGGGGVYILHIPPYNSSLAQADTFYSG